MIGISLSYKWLLGAEEDGLPKPQALLPQLWKRGVRSVEIRMVPLCADPAEVRKTADLLWDYGFNVTVHGRVQTAENAVAEALEPLTGMLAHMRQRDLIVTVHPIVGDNAAMLVALSDAISEKGYPVRIALENERRLPDKSEGDSLALVLDAVTRADRKNVGICFDMGHFAWYAERFTDTPGMLPPKAFLDRVIHTHIHACTDGTTHYPLDAWREPFAAYIDALSYGYFGVYNIELSPHRFAHRWGAAEAFCLSVDTLKENLPFCAALYGDLREHYDDRFRRALDVFNRNDGCYVSLISASSYLFNTNGFHWAMDVAFRYLWFLAETPARVRDYIGHVKLMVLTHGHVDHMEEETVRLLADTDMLWLVPEFIADDVMGFGVRREKMIVVKAGETVSVGPLTFRVLPGRHYRPDTGVGLEAVGYLVTADNAPSLAFPGDIRDYRTDVIEKQDADFCFAHVWLTDKALEPEKYVPKSREFADFMLAMSRRNILLAHLYENGRKEEAMWQLYHARIAAEAIREKSPGTVVRVPQCGEILQLLP